MIWQVYLFPVILSPDDLLHADLLHDDLFPVALATDDLHHADLFHDDLLPVALATDGLFHDDLFQDDLFHGALSPDDLFHDNSFHDGFLPEGLFHAAVSLIVSSRDLVRYPSSRTALSFEKLLLLVSVYKEYAV